MKVYAIMSRQEILTGLLCFPPDAAFTVYEAEESDLELAVKNGAKLLPVKLFGREFAVELKAGKSTGIGEPNAHEKVRGTLQENVPAEASASPVLLGEMPEGKIHG